MDWCFHLPPACGAGYSSWSDGDRGEYSSGCCVTKPSNMEVAVGLAGGRGWRAGVCAREPALPWADLPGDCRGLRLSLQRAWGCTREGPVGGSEPRRGLALKKQGQRPLPLAEPGRVHHRTWLELSEPGRSWLLKCETREMATSRLPTQRQWAGLQDLGLLRLSRVPKGENSQGVARRLDGASEVTRP